MMTKKKSITTQSLQTKRTLLHLYIDLSLISKDYRESAICSKSAFASYAVALLLLKEEMNLPSDQVDELFEKFYHHLKKENKITADQLTESINEQIVSTRNISSSHPNQTKL